MFNHIIVFTILVYSVECQTWNPAIEQEVVGFINNAMECRRLQGLSVVITQKDQVLMQRGFGYADTATETPATSDTRFCIGSCTKAFTGTILGALLEEQGFSDGWDTRLTDIFGESFELGDDYRNELGTVRDLLAHKTGIAQYSGHILMGVSPDITRQQICQRFRFLEPVRDFRVNFLYNNWIYTLASCAAEELGGQDYETLVRSRIFDVLGMNDTLLPEEITDWSQIATSYFINEITDEIETLDPELILIYPNDASGGICSSAVDVAKWLQWQLTDFKTSILADQLWQETVEPQFSVPRHPLAKPVFPVTDDTANYGLAWDVGSYRGYRKQLHTGSVSGFQTRLTVYKDMDLAIYTSSNGPMYAGIAHEVLHNHISDLVLGLETWLDNSTACSFPAPWLPQEEIRQYTIRTNPDVFYDQSINPEYYMPGSTDASSTAASYDAFVGQYGHPFFGNISISYDDIDDQLRFEGGKFGTGFLVNTTEVEGWFEVHLDGSLGYFHVSGPEMGTYPPLLFRNYSDASGLYQELYGIGIDPLVPPTYYRDLQWDGPFPEYN